MALKFGTPLKGKDYVSAGSSHQVVWPAAANAAFGNHVAGIVRDQQGALDQVSSRSSEGKADSQVIISAKGTLADKQYLLWEITAVRHHRCLTGQASSSRRGRGKSEFRQCRNCASRFPGGTAPVRRIAANEYER